MDIGSLLLGLALAAVIAFIVARPLIEHTAPGEQPASLADQLTGERERVLTQLRDLDFDQTMGKINPDDYNAQRAQLVAAGVAILKQLDALGVEAQSPAPATAAEPAPLAAAAPSDDIEAAVAQRRARWAPVGASAPLRRPATPARVAVAPAVPAKAFAPRSAPAPRNLDDAIEASVAQRRAARPAQRPLAEKAAVVAPLPTAETQPNTPSLTCAQCGTEVLPDDRFCPKCGSIQTIACEHCGRVARAGDQFCAQCGQSLPATNGQASLPT